MISGTFEYLNSLNTVYNRNSVQRTNMAARDTEISGSVFDGSSPDMLLAQLEPA